MAEMKEDQRLQDKRLQERLAVLGKELTVAKQSLEYIINAQIFIANNVTTIRNDFAIWRVKTDNTLASLTTKVNQMQTRVEDIAKKVGA